MTVQQSVLARFYDLLDGFADGDPVAHLAEDFDFAMMFPGTADIPIERFAGGKGDFKRFMDGFAALGGRFQHSATERRHNIGTLTFVDGIELMVGEGRGGRRNGTLLAAASEDREGKLSRYLFLMTSVRFPDTRDRSTLEQPLVIPRFFDRLDGIVNDDPVDLLSEDFQFEMVFPGLQGAPDERVSGNKADFRRFMEQLRARGPSVPMPPGERRHYIKLSAAADGLEFMVGEARNGRRNGTILAAAQQDPEGKLRRYAVGMGSVRFSPLDRT
jgi:hypothetical protein